MAEGIYYIGHADENGEYPLEFCQFSTAKSRVLRNLGRYIYAGISVSPDQQTILFVKSATSDAHLMMIENFE